MSRIRSVNTMPEVAVRSLLHNCGYRFRLHRKDLPGKPDIVLPKYRTAIFVHGCFWHRHENCKYATMPKSNVEYWVSKFQKNIERDKKKHELLLELGWRVLIVWGCELSDPQALIRRLDSELDSKLAE